MSEDCAKAVEELYTFLDGELTESKRVMITEHLDACPPCFDAFDFERDLRDVVSRSCAETVPDDLRRRIAAIILAEK